MKFIKHIILYLLIILTTNSIFAQPYIFLKGNLVDSTQSPDKNYWFYNINRFNLNTGNKELFLYNGYNFELLTWDPTQSWLISDYFGYEPSKLISCNDTLVAFDLPEEITGSKEKFLYSSKKNKIYVIGYHDSSLTLDSYNLITKKIDSSIPILREDIYNDEGMFFSSDKERIYLPVSEPVTRKEHVMIYSTSSEQILSLGNLENYGYSNANAYALYEGGNGKALIGSFFWGDTTEYIRFFDFDTNSGSAFITYKGDAVPHYINNDYFILADNSFDPTDRSTYNSGKIHICNTKTTKFVKTIILPPRGKIYTFDNYPGRFYYVKDLETSPQVFSINIDSIVNEDQGLNHNIKFLNSQGTLLTGGTLQYYEGSWKEGINNGDGTFLVNTTQPRVSLRMTYEGGSQTLSNVSLSDSIAIFRTVNAQVQLQNSAGNPIDTGRVQYYAGSWREFGYTSNGTASKELLTGNYSFRMTYAYASNDKQQNIGTNPTVVFQTINAAIELRNSAGNLIDQGTVQYYSGAWRNIGTTSNGVVNVELLPNNYSFRMSYAYASNDKQQNIGTNPTVVFQTVNAAIELRNSTGNLIDQGSVQYYSGAWRSIGTTSNGVVNIELLPNNYSFRMTYAFASNDKQQNIDANPVVVFQTVNTAIELRNSTGNLIDQGSVQYYSGAWRNIGTTSNGVVNIELLPNNYSFRMSYAFVSNDKQQNIGTNPTVTFSTVLCTVRVIQQGQPVNNADIKYYSGAWRQFGLTSNGEVTKELLPANLTFRAAYSGTSQDKTQNITANNIVEFVLP